MNGHDGEIRSRIARLVDSVQDDQARTHELFHYVWTMMCVKRGLLQIVREEPLKEGTRIILREVRTNQERLAIRPAGLDDDVEGLAVQALARILGSIRAAS